jgi:hypothetical protein
VSTMPPRKVHQPRRIRDRWSFFEKRISIGGLPPLFPRCFGVCLVRPRRVLCLRWQAIGHNDEEAVLCANCVTSYPVPRSTRRTGVFIDFRASDASSAYSTSRRETGEASFLLRVEISKAMHAVR